MPDFRRYESAAHRALCELALDLHADEGAPHPLTWARAAARLHKWQPIADEHVRDELESVGVCAECLRLEAECQCCRCFCTCAAFIFADGRDCGCPPCETCERVESARGAAE